MRRVCRRASCRRARRRRNDAGSVSLHLGGGSPAALRIALSAYRFSRQRGSLCAPVFRRKRDVRFAPPYVKQYTAPTYPPPLVKRLTPALRCAQRYAEVKGEPLGCKVQKTVLRRRSIRSPCVYPCLPVLLFAAARELSHVCLSAEVGHLRCAAYEAVCGIRSGRDKLSDLLDAEVAYGFGVIPLVQRLAPALHRVKRCAEAEGIMGRKGGCLPWLRSIDCSCAPLCPRLLLFAAARKLSHACFPAEAGASPRTAVFEAVRAIGAIPLGWRQTARFLCTRSGTRF